MHLASAVAQSETEKELDQKCLEINGSVAAGLQLQLRSFAF